MWLTLRKFWLLLPLWLCNCYFCFRFQMWLPQGHLRWPSREPLYYSPSAPCTNLLHTILIINPHQNQDYLGDCLITIYLNRQPACSMPCGWAPFLFSPYHNVCAPHTAGWEQASNSDLLNTRNWAIAEFQGRLKWRRATERKTTKENQDLVPLFSWRQNLWVVKFTNMPSKVQLGKRDFYFLPD